jgi:hypothetical protein
LRGFAALDPSRGFAAFDPSRGFAATGLAAAFLATFADLMGVLLVIALLRR